MRRRRWTISTPRNVSSNASGRRTGPISGAAPHPPRASWIARGCSPSVSGAADTTAATRRSRRNRRVHHRHPATLVKMTARGKRRHERRFYLPLADGRRSTQTRPRPRGTSSRRSTTPSHPPRHAHPPLILKSRADAPGLGTVAASPLAPSDRSRAPPSRSTAPPDAPVSARCACATSPLGRRTSRACRGARICSTPSVSRPGS